MSQACIRLTRTARRKVNSPVSMPLFVFGSLRDCEVLKLVLGRVPADIRTETAWLPGYRVVRLPDENYPVLVPAPENTVPGDLLRGLSTEDYGRIAFFENQEYRFERCTVKLPGGDWQNALFCGEGQTVRGAHEPWSLKTWQRIHKALFMEHTHQFMKFYGAVDSEKADEIWRELKERR